MWTVVLISIGILFLSFLLLGYISPYFKDNTDIFTIQGEKIIEVPVEIIIEKEVIKEVPVEKIIIKEVPIEVIKEVPVEKIVEIIKEVEVPVKKIINVEESDWKNIGLELYNTTDLDKFLEILDGLIGKTLLIITDSSYVLGENFTDHKVYEGILDTYEILEGRYPHQPIVKFNIIIPILGTTKVNLAWIYDKYKLNLDFSSLELVDDFIKTGIPKNELFLVKN
jgi:arsenate reductase-like glutaredoxin family protein